MSLPPHHVADNDQAAARANRELTGNVAMARKTLAAAMGQPDEGEVYAMAVIARTLIDHPETDREWLASNLAAALIRLAKLPEETR